MYFEGLYFLLISLSFSTFFYINSSHRIFSDSNTISTLVLREKLTKTWQEDEKAESRNLIVNDKSM